MNNRINATLAAADLAALDEALATVQARLPFLVDLTPEERRTITKMGGRSQEFVRAAADVAEQNIDLLPRNFDPADLRQDVVLYDQLSTLLQKLEKLVELVGDTTMLAGSEAMAGALVVYGSVQKNGRGAALDGALDDLARRFKRRAQEPATPAS